MSEKANAEYNYWKSRFNQQGVLSHNHFEYFFTSFFGVEKAFFEDKRILDIGCGPRGSLEWARGSALRIGIDPLASAYRKLGTGSHVMDYITGQAEALPFPDALFDVVSSFNSLDHVDELERVIGEIKRVLAPQGYFLLLTDIHSRPTVLEPSIYSWEIVKRFKPELEVLGEKHIEPTIFSPEGFSDLYQSAQRGVPYDHARTGERNGILAAKFFKRC